jgi:hypothetical protein
MRRTALSLSIAVLSWVAPSGCGGSGTPVVPPATPSYGLLFDGDDDIAIAVGGPGFAALSTRTIEAWVHPLSLVPVAGYGAIAFLPASAGILLHPDPSQWTGNICVPGCASAESPIGSLLAGVWQHLAMVFDGAEIRIYRNGTLVDTEPHAGVAGGSAQLDIGRWGKSWHGLIDEVRVWSIARTQAEIQADMNAVLTGAEPGLDSYWRFEEGAGQTFSDHGPNARPGTLGNSAAVESNDPLWGSPGAPVSGP